MATAKTTAIPRSDFARWGQIGGLTRASRGDSKKHMEPALRAFMVKWEREVDPEGKIAAAVRELRATHVLFARVSSVTRTLKGDYTGLRFELLDTALNRRVWSATNVPSRGPFGVMNVGVVDLMRRDALLPPAR